MNSTNHTSTFLQPLSNSTSFPNISALLQHVPAMPTAAFLSSSSSSSLLWSSSVSPTAATSSPLATVSPASAAVSGVGPQAVQVSTSGEGVMERDPVNGAFLGGVPLKTVDVPLAFIFLALFALGAFRHISTYRANAKRGHKFLLSDLMFDFCMVRVLTCIFRIIWAFTSPRGVVLAANIFENGGASVIFAVNLFFSQRIIRAMHPTVGWHPFFSYGSLFLIFSVPAVIIMNIVSISVSFFSAGNPSQLEAAETVLRFGASWNMMLSVMPLIWIFLACAHPGPPPENFGSGDFRAKTALVIYSATSLAFGAAVRLAVVVNPAAPDTTSALYSKGVFYTTGFLLEIFTVALYAVVRIDLLFYIPDGSSGPGDYSRKAYTGGLEQALTSEEIQREIDKLGVRHEIFKSGRVQNDSSPILAVFYPKEHQNSVDRFQPPPLPASGENDVGLPPRVSRVSRRQSLMQALRSSRPPRPDRSTVYITAEALANLPLPEKDPNQVSQWDER